MSQLFDYVEEYLNGGFAGLRAAIRTKGKLPMTEHDNSNRISLWEKADGIYQGYGEFCGKKVFRAVVLRNARDSGPVAYLLFSDADGDAREVSIWQNEKVVDGRTEKFLGGSTGDYWVNAYRNELEEGSKKPHLSIVFKPQAQQSARSEQPAASGSPL
ncbi:MAG: hypothetical protein AAGI37_20995 [Planctomycetota bacterium]